MDKQKHSDQLTLTLQENETSSRYAQRKSNQHSLKSLVDSYCPGRRAPESIPASERPFLNDAIEQATAMLAPVSEYALEVLLKRVFRHYPKPHGEYKEILKDYQLILGKYPEDLVEFSCTEILRTFRFNMMPKIGDFTSIMEKDMGERRSILLALQVLLSKVSDNIAN